MCNKKKKNMNVYKKQTPPPLCLQFLFAFPRVLKQTMTIENESNSFASTCKPYRFSILYMHHTMYLFSINNPFK